MTKQKLRVFILDDEFLINRSLQIAIKSKGHEVQSAFSAEEALNLWKVFQPHLAFVDILLPGISGLDFLKQRPKNFPTKIVLISAHDNLNQEEIISAGADLFAKKPFENIFDFVEKCLNLIPPQET